MQGRPPAPAEQIQSPLHPGICRSDCDLLLRDHSPLPQIRLCLQIMKEVRRALCNAATDDSKLLLLSAVGSVFCSGLDYSYLIGRLSSDRRKESTRIAEAIR